MFKKLERALVLRFLVRSGRLSREDAKKLGSTFPTRSQFKAAFRAVGRELASGYGEADLFRGKKAPLDLIGYYGEVERLIRYRRGELRGNYINTHNNLILPADRPYIGPEQVLYERVVEKLPAAAKTPMAPHAG